MSTLPKQDERTPGLGPLQIHSQWPHDIYGPNGNVASAITPEAAAFIVQACNAYTSTDALRSALKFYANSRNYDHPEHVGSVPDDGGKIARAALSTSTEVETSEREMYRAKGLCEPKRTYDPLSRDYDDEIAE